MTVLSVRAVRDIQTRLRDRGTFPDRIDGDLGPLTWAGLIRWVGRRGSMPHDVAMTRALAAAARTAQINSGLRIAHFLSQIAVESGGFARLEENLNYTAPRLCQVWPARFPTLESAQPCAGNPQALANRVYGGRLGNGPAASGDGWRYRGRGLIQLTGKDNYREAAGYTRLSLVDRPEIAADPAKSAEIACHYWTSRAINKAADKDDVLAVRRAVNGGTHGIDDVRTFLARAKTVLVG